MESDLEPVKLSVEHEEVINFPPVVDVRGAWMVGRNTMYRTEGIACEGRYVLV